MKALMAILIFLFSLINAYAYSSNSLYSIPLQWKDDQSRDTTLNAFQGKNIVLAMVYTSCRSVCPLIVSKLKKIEKAAAAKNLEIEFVLVSLDPERDSPQMLEAFRKRENLSSQNWHLLVGSAADTRKLSNLISFNYSKNSLSGEIMHSNKISLLNKEGEIISVSDGLNDEIEPFIAKVN